MPCVHYCLSLGRGENIHTKQIQCPITACILLGSHGISWARAGRTACWSLNGQSRGIGCRGCRASHAAHFSRVNERRAAGIRPRLARVHLCHPCSFVTESSCALPGRPSGHVHARLFSPFPAWEEGTPLSLPSPPRLPVSSPAVSPFLHCPTRYCPACSRRGVSTSGGL